MRLTKTLFIIAMLLCIPYMTLAFSWGNLFSWIIPESKNQIEKSIKITDLTLTSQEKHYNWTQMYETKDFAYVISNDENFIFTQENLNYIINQEMMKVKDSPIENLKLFLLNNEIELKGYLLKPWKGELIIRAKIFVIDNQIKIEVSKVRFRGLYFPKSIVQNLIDKYAEPITAFLYEYPDYQNIDIKINNNYLKLNYN